jgi:predicted porin
MQLTHAALLAAAAALPLQTMAQSNGNGNGAGSSSSAGTGTVTIYGIVDYYVEHLNHVPVDSRRPEAGRSGVTRVGSGGWNTSRFGFKGSEPLGNGLTAQFALENGFAGDTGESTGGLFARQAWVGLSSKSWGRLQIGRTTTAIYDLVVPHDPMAVAPRYSWLPSNGSDSTYSFSSRLNNMVKYSVDAGPVKAIAHYSFGEQTGRTKAGAGYGIGAMWTVMPALSVEASYDQRNGVPNAEGAFAETRALSLSAKYQLGPAAMTLGAIRYDQEPTAGADRKSNLYWAGLEYQVTAPLRAVAAVYRENLPDTSSDPTMVVLAGNYALSKRTDFYLAAAYAWAERDGARQTPVGVVRSSEAAPLYANQAGVAVGIRHRF